jgi:hypothetical protein
VLLFGFDIGIYRVAHLLCQFEFHRMSGFALSDFGSIGGQPARCNVFDLQASQPLSLLSIPEGNR